MAARSVIVHHLRSAAGMRDVLGCHLFHHGTHLGARIGGIPMHVVGHVAVAVMSAQMVPILLISIVAAWILAIDRGLRLAVRPYRGDAMRSLDPAAQTRHVLQAGRALRAAR